MHKKTFAKVLLTALLAAAPAGATVEESRYSGHLCQGAGSADRGQILYNSSGAMNNDTTASRVVYCGARWQGALANTNSIYAIVSYFDRSSVDSLSCRLEVLGHTGTVYTSPWVYSCSTSGGCASATASFASASIMRMDLSLTHPVIGMYSWAIRCNVPRRSTSLGNLSGIIGYTYSHDAVGF